MSVKNHFIVKTWALVEQKLRMNFCVSLHLSFGLPVDEQGEGAVRRARARESGG